MRTLTEQFDGLVGQMESRLEDPLAGTAERVRIASRVRSGSGIKAACRKVLVESGLLGEKDKLYVKTGCNTVSQLSPEQKGDCFLLSLLEDRASLRKFSSEQARPFGKSPHGQRSKSDAVRVCLDDVPGVEVVWSQKYD